ncbi:hypothetical protein [Jannaschia faecimaris]|nr:hypothetical protein [Jannaschia faecimaris]
MIRRLALRAVVAVALGVSLWLVADRVVERTRTDQPAQAPVSDG